MYSNPSSSFTQVPINNWGSECLLSTGLLGVFYQMSFACELWQNFKLKVESHFSGQQVAGCDAKL